MELDWTRGELAEGLRCYRAENFFEAHEHWEAVWLNAAEPQKTLLQAVIQVAAAFYHYRRNNLLGTASLLEGARKRLEAYPDEFGGINVAGFRIAVSKWLELLAGEITVEALEFPPIEVCRVGGNHP